LGRESYRSPSNTKSPVMRPTFTPSGILIHPAVWPQRTWARKLGAVPLLGELGPHLTQCGRGRGLPPCQVSSSSVQPYGHNTPTLQTAQDRTDRTTVANRFTIGRPIFRKRRRNHSCYRFFLGGGQQFVNGPPYAIGPFSMSSPVSPVCLVVCLFVSLSVCDVGVQGRSVGGAGGC